MIEEICRGFNGNNSRARIIFLDLLCKDIFNDTYLPIHFNNIPQQFL